MKKVLPQIAFDFASEPEQQLPAQVREQASPAGVGFRVKSLKNGGALPGTEVQAPQLPLLMPEAGEITHAERAPAPVIEIKREEEAPDMDTPETDAPAAGTVVAAGRAVKSKRGRKSLKQVAAEADLIEIPADEVLFRKQYYSMGEVAQMFRVNQSLLRFWETEFAILQPRKNKKGDRHFRPVDIKNLHLIYHLLRQRKYTIEGAKDFLKKNKKAEQRFEAIQRLQQIRAFLLELKAQI
jgi:DNA-binding transcriptional MerR regulator